MQSIFLFELPNFLLKLEYYKNQKSSLAKTKKKNLFNGFILVKCKHNRTHTQTLNIKKDGK